MPQQSEALRVIVYDTYTVSTRTMVAELTGQFDRLRFSTKLHGGFSRLSVSQRTDLDLAWTALARGNLPGWHFYHVEVKEEERLVWEGRILAVEIDPTGVGPMVIEAVGYWASTRDQDYKTSEGTDWTAGGPHTIDDMIKEMLTANCPDINSDHSNIEDPGLDQTGMTELAKRRWVQDQILGLNFTDSTGDQWYFAIWDDRIPYLFQRDPSNDGLNWMVDRSMLLPSKLRQDASQLRNNVLPRVNDVEGTAAADSDSQAIYPTRDLVIDFLIGMPDGAAEAERDRVLAERKDPQQSQFFVINADPIVVGADGVDATVDLGNTAPMWRMRAGEIIRISDLIPPSVKTVDLDTLTTFFILETEFDYIRNTLTVTPDRSRRRISQFLANQGQLEPGR